MANPYIPYYIILDRSVLTEQLTYPQGILLSPSDAAAQYGAQIVYAAGSGVPPPNNFSPRIGVPPLPTASILTVDVASATFSSGTTVDSDGVVHTQAASTGGTIEWRGFFFTEIPNSDTVQALSPRYWANGFEIPNQGDGNTSGPSGALFHRSASRTIDGLGYAYRGISPGSIVQIGSLQHETWERLYFRIRRLSTTGTAWFWASFGTVHGTESLLAGLTTAGGIEFYSCGAQVFPGTLLFTLPAPPLNLWCRMEIRYKYAVISPPPGVAGDGVLDVSVVGPGFSTAASAINGQGGSTGLQTIQTHASSLVGTSRTVANTAEIDFDDWSGFDYEDGPGGPTTRGYQGTHIRALHPTGYGTNHSTASWTGDYRTLAGNPVAGQSDAVAGTTSGSTLEVITDYADYGLGCSVLTAAYYNVSQSSAGTANLGYRTPDGLTVSAVTVAQATWKTARFSMSTLTPLETVNIVYQKNSSGNESVQVLQATAEFVGSFGPEDDAEQVWPPRTGVHNVPYWDQSFAQSFTVPASPVAVMSGTYVGTGTGQDIEVATPIHWFWCRPLTGNTGGIHWWSSMLAGHDQTSRLPAVNRFVRAYRGPTVNDIPGAYKVQVSGASTQCNALGITYQWVAFSDIGMRYLLNGAETHTVSDTSYTNVLADYAFTPEAAFLVAESTSGGTNGHLYRGPGHTTDTASPIAATQVSTIATFGTGSLVSLASELNTVGRAIAYSCWRSSDGTGTGPVALTSYTGDGTGNRTITLTLGGRYPHFALVVPHNGVSYFRDPSHTGTTSETVAGAANASTAIRGGGVNQLLVGSVLNANAIVYDVFALAGDLTGPGGWSANPTDPTEPIFPVPTVVPTTPGAWAPTDTKGWWMSANGFGGNADLITAPLNPKYPRHWDKLAVFATGSAAMLGGSPGAGVTYNNHLIYAGDDYTLASTNPIIRIFDGLSDRLLATVPPVVATPARAIVSMILVGTTVYFTTLDSGTTSSNFAGRVFALDILSGNVTQVGGGFSGGEVPYALVFHMGRLWLGTNKGNGTAGTVYFFRPGIDTAWTTDHTLSTDSAGGACSMFSYKGTLYVGCDAASGTASKILARSGVGAWTTSHTAATTAQNNGHLSMMEFQGNLFVGYWNNTSTSLIKRFDGTTWTSAFGGVTTTIRPYIGMFISDDILYVVGGGNALSASLVSSVDGISWDDNTPFLTGPTTETALPIFGVIGV